MMLCETQRIAQLLSLKFDMNLNFQQVPAETHWINLGPSNHKAFTELNLCWTQVKKQQVLQSDQKTTVQVWVGKDNK